MNSRASMSCFSNTTTSQMYPTTRDDVVSSSLPPIDPHFSSSLLYNLSVLQEKVHQIQSFVGVLISPAPDPHHQFEQTASLAIASIESLVQEIIPAASSIVFTCQQLALSSNNSIGSSNDTPLQNHQLSFLDHSYSRNDYRFQESNLVQESEQVAYSSQEMQNLDCYGGNKYAIINRPGSMTNSTKNKEETCKKNFDIVEIGAEDLLAKYTHYCKICGKGFKRDANLRMHMRAHGDQYKTVEALTNPMKRENRVNPDEDEQMDSMEPRKGYSCPQQGCRWNQRHEKFQPLKSIICVKNHYKRSHCPKMYVCKRCNVKQFSVLSDLRTHEKHCGDVKWVCSCGTRFSRKDKLLGHVGLFVGHFPVDSSSSAVMKRMKVDDS